MVVKFFDETSRPWMEFYPLDITRPTVFVTLERCRSGVPGEVDSFSKINWPSIGKVPWWDAELFAKAILAAVEQAKRDEGVS